MKTDTQTMKWLNTSWNQYIFKLIHIVINPPSPHSNVCQSFNELIMRLIIFNVSNTFSVLSFALMRDGTYLVKDFPLTMGGLRSRSHWFESSWYFCARVYFWPRIFTRVKGFTTNELFLLDTWIWKYNISFPQITTAEVTDWSGAPGGGGDRGRRRGVTRGRRHSQDFGPTEHASCDFKVLLMKSERSGELLLQSTKREEDERVFFSHSVDSPERQTESQRATRLKYRCVFVLYCLPVKL